MKMNYGLVSHSHAISLAKAVCQSLGNGKNNNADLQLIESACAETRLGEYADPTPDGAGRGATQVDSDTFYWLKELALEIAPGACMRHKRGWRDKISRDFGIDLKRIEHSDLDYNPLLAFIWARFRYLVVTAPIPTTIEGRAAYWKRHYNSSLGKGDEQHYLESCYELLEIPR